MTEVHITVNTQWWAHQQSSWKKVLLIPVLYYVKIQSQMVGRSKVESKKKISSFQNLRVEHLHDLALGTEFSSRKMLSANHERENNHWNCKNNYERWSSRTLTELKGKNRFRSLCSCYLHRTKGQSINQDRSNPVETQAKDLGKPFMRKSDKRMKAYTQLDSMTTQEKKKSQLPLKCTVLNIQPYWGMF